MPPSIWPSTRQRVERPPDVLRRGDLHHLDQPELGVDVDHGAVGDEGERHVAVALPVVVEVLGRAVVVLDRLARTRRLRRGVGDGHPQRRPSSRRPRRPRSPSAAGRRRAPRRRARTVARAPPGRPRRPRRRSSTSGATPTSSRPTRWPCRSGRARRRRRRGPSGRSAGRCVTKPWPDLGGGELQRRHARRPRAGSAPSSSRRSPRSTSGS